MPVGFVPAGIFATFAGKSYLVGTSSTTSSKDSKCG